MNYETVIGLEVHAQLLTKSKMYCGCSSDYANTPPNTHVCPVCLGMPGVLPVINRQAVEYVMMTALALNCGVAEYTKFDRKNYPYPDLMKGYQISQYDAPIGLKGWLSIEAGGQTKQVGITRVHLEEDVAKLLHRNETGEHFSLVDVNRSGVPLMEIVGEPDLRSPEEARQYLQKLHSILQYLGVSTGNMEEGSFRCDANVSVRPAGSSTLGTKIEIKNLNSFKAVEKALAYEIERQSDTLADGGTLTQETRLWDENRQETRSMRSKESAHDYRYFPDPDLLPLAIDDGWIEKVRASLPELPQARKDRFISEYGLPAYDAELLTGRRDIADYFEGALKIHSNAKAIGNWIIGDLFRVLKERKLDEQLYITDWPVRAEHIAGMVRLVDQGKISGKIAKTVFDALLDSDRSPQEIIAEKGLEQISDAGSIESAVEQIISAHPKQVADFRAGNEKIFGFLVGQIMKATQGKANPQKVNEVLRQKLQAGD